MNDLYTQEEIGIVIDKLGFWGTVHVVKIILEKIYPLDVFKDSPDIGARFTNKLHEAMAILDELPAQK